MYLYIYIERERERESDSDRVIHVLNVRVFETIVSINRTITNNNFKLGVPRTCFLFTIYIYIYNVYIYTYILYFIYLYIDTYIPSADLNRGQAVPV